MNRYGWLELEQGAHPDFGAWHPAELDRTLEETFATTGAA